MKKIYSILLLVVSICFTKTNFATQLSGTYTINPSVAASTTNFQNFASAITYLTSAGTRSDAGPANSSPFGVSGPVQFNVSSATFTGQVTVPAITGTSTTNNITFKGTGRTTTIVTFASTLTTSRHTVGLNLCKYVTFRDMTIRGTGSSWGWGVHITGTNSNNNAIKNCLVELTGTGATSTSTNFAGIVISGSTSSATTGVRIDSTEIDSNTILNTGYAGIVAFGLSGNLQTDARIRNNQILGSGSYACYLSFQNGINILGNFLSSRTSNLYNYGLYLLNSTSSTGRRGIVSNNRIINFGYQGLWISSSNNPTGNKGLVSNNIIGGMVKYDYGRPMFFSNSSQWTIVHNTVNHDIPGAVSDYSAAYFSGGSGNAVYNNIFNESKAGQGLPFYATGSTIFDTLNYNLYNRADTSNGVLMYIGTNLNSGAFRGASSQNVNSIVANPLFVNDTNLMIDNACYAGIPIASVPTDFNGNPRSTTNPTMGAYEVTALSNNLQVVAITSPTPPLTAGLNDLKVLVRNNGNNTVSSFNISYRNNTSTLRTQAWSGSLSPCDTVTVTFSGADQINIGNINNVLVYSAGPNSTVDANRANDTIRTQFYLPLSGTYTVGGTSPDFATPADAVFALYAGGLASAVTFDVRPGTYVGQLTLENPILGLSSTNTISFIGQNKNTCIIEFNNQTNTTRHIVKIGVSNITFRNLTIRSNSPNYAWGVHISKNGVNNVTIANNNIQLLSTAAISGTSDFFGGILMGGANNSLYYYDTYVLDNIFIDSNNITNGYFGIYQFSYFYSGYYSAGAQSEKIFIRNNTVNNAYNHGIYAAGLKGITVTNNSLSLRKNSGAYAYNLFLSQISLPADSFDFIVTGNKMYNSSYIGMYFDNIIGRATKRGRVFNNIVAGGFSIAGSYGFNGYSVSYVDFYHNSFLVDDIATSNSSSAFYIGFGSANRIRNNHFVVSNSTSLATPLYLSTSSIVSDTTQLNYNNYYKPDTAAASYIYVGTSLNYSTFIGASGYNRNSIGRNPSFINDTNLVTNDGCMNGDTISLVTTDINGTTRSTIPDIGAYEIAASANDAGVTGLTSPSYPVAAGLQDITIKFKNNGSNSITNVNVGYIHNGGTPKIVTYSGSALAPCDTTSITLTGTNQINIVAGVTNTVKIFTSGPNSTTDPNVANDTLVLVLGTPLKGNYTIGSSPSNFSTITSAVNALNIRGVDSAVNFLIKTGTYNESVNLQTASGMSASNTVTFTSLANNKDSVRLAWNTGTGNNYVLQFSGNFFKVNAITLQSIATSGNSIYGVVVGSNASYDTLSNCAVRIPYYYINTFASNTYTVYANNVSGTGVGYVNNIFTGSYYGVYYYGNSSNRPKYTYWKGNTFDSAYYAPFHYNYYGNYSTFDGNTFKSVPTVSLNNNYMYWYYQDSAYTFINNKADLNNNGATYWYHFYCANTPSARGLVANNALSSVNLIMYWGNTPTSNIDFLNNSFNTGGGYFYIANTGLTNVRINNNLFNATGTYAFYITTAPNIATLNCNYNNYFSGSTTPIYSAAARSLTTHRATYPLFDRNSISYRTAYSSTTNLTPNPNDTAVWLINGRGDYLPRVTTDINGNVRPLTFADGAPDLGAFNINPNPSTLAPLATASPATPTAGTTQLFTLGLDTVASITWDAFATPPTSISVRQYSGRAPQIIGTVTNYMNFYTDIQTPAGSYLYDIKLNYRNNWLGTMTNTFGFTEADLRIAKKDVGTAWSTNTASTVDSTLNTMTGIGYTSFSWFTGSDLFNQLPVNLVSFNGVARGNNVSLNWATASEINSNVFEIERSFDGRTFETIGRVKAKGNSSSLVNYNYTDLNVLNTNRVAYYRLKMVDRDNSFEYSITVRLTSEDVKNRITVGPNPFKNIVILNNVVSNSNIEIIDINGKVVYKTTTIADGTIDLNLPETIKAGVYFVKVNDGDYSETFKLIKN